MLNEIKKVGNAPTNSGPAVKGTFVGPFVYLYQESSGGVTTVDAYFVDFFETPCSSMKDFGDAKNSADANYGKLFPGISGMLSGTSVTTEMCYLKQSFTYTPS